MLAFAHIWPLSAFVTPALPGLHLPPVFASSADLSLLEAIRYITKGVSR